MTEPTELLPCPFCGSPDVAIADDLVTFNGLCNACGASGGYSSYRNGATWLWNRRTPQPTQAQAGAVPLTDAEARSLVWSIDSAWCRSDSVSEEDALELVRATEHRHGIKGGQHGPA